MSLKIAVIYGSVRSDRQGIKAAKFMMNKGQAKGWDMTLIDPLEYDLPLLDKMHKEYEPGQAPANLEKISKILAEADAFIVVSAEYNHSLPPALSNLMDYFQAEYMWKPSGIVSYSAGSFGGARVADHLRVFMGELGAIAVPTMFAISKIGDSFDDSGQAIDQAYDKRVGRFLDELQWYSEALKASRAKGLPR